MPPRGGRNGKLEKPRDAKELDMPETPFWVNGAAYTQLLPAEQAI